MLCKRLSVSSRAHPNYSEISGVHFHFLCSPVQHLTSPKFIYILDCQRKPYRKWKTSLQLFSWMLISNVQVFHKHSSIHSVSQDYRMRMHYYHHPEAGNKGAYRKPQKNTAEGPEKQAWEHTGVLVYLSTSPDCTGHCQKWEVALTAVHLLHISNTKRLSEDDLNMKAHASWLQPYPCFGFFFARLPSQSQKHKLVPVALCV